MHRADDSASLTGDGADRPAEATPHPRRRTPGDERHAKHQRDEADKAFRKAWKLLGRLERRLVAARAEEERRMRQLGDGTGRKTAKRLTQLEAAQSEIAEIEGLLTELTGPHRRHAQTRSGQLVQDVAREVAASIRADAAAEPDGWPDGTPTNGRGSIRGRAGPSPLTPPPPAAGPSMRPTASPRRPPSEP